MISDINTLLIIIRPHFDDGLFYMNGESSVYFQCTEEDIKYSVMIKSYNHGFVQPVTISKELYEYLMSVGNEKSIIDIIKLLVDIRKRKLNKVC